MLTKNWTEIKQNENRKKSNKNNQIKGLREIPMMPHPFMSLPGEWAGHTLCPLSITASPANHNYLWAQVCVRGQSFSQSGRCSSLMDVSLASSHVSRVSLHS